MTKIKRCCAVHILFSNLLQHQENPISWACWGPLADFSAVTVGGRLVWGFPPVSHSTSNSVCLSLSLSVSLSGLLLLILLCVNHNKVSNACYFIWLQLYCYHGCRNGHVSWNHVNCVRKHISASIIRDVPQRLKSCSLHIEPKHKQENTECDT